VLFRSGLTEEQKLIAEVWEDGAGTAFPPGSWMTFGQFVSARDGHDLDADAQMFFALANALMDAGIAAWEAKTHYDYVRPVRAIRELGDLGLIGAPGTDELTGEIGHVVEAWAGPGADAATILAENFITYQTPGSDVSPPFAEYISGHSAFSAAGAAVLALYAGSDSFGAGIEFAPGSSRFEPGLTPSETVTLSWDSFTDAADEAGISRLYGGIHFEDGDLYGRTLGRAAGEAAFREAMVLIAGGKDASPELADALTVGRMFEAALGRVAQFAGLNFWEDAAEAGFDAQRLAEAFLTSPEFTDRFGTPEALGAEGLVDTLFLNLGLDAAATDLDETLLGALADGQASAADTLVALVQSPEVAEATAYLAALDETGDGAIWFA
jgi:hypothetical protein